MDRVRYRCNIEGAAPAASPDLDPLPNLATLERAIALAVAAHAGQYDKAGAPYILHPLRVMFAVQGHDARMAAVLHDVVEDCGVTLDQLRGMGFAEPVIEAVDALTKRDYERGADRYMDFVRRAGRNDIALVVKLADIADNMDLARISSPSEADLARVARYRKARSLLLRMKRDAEYEAVSAEDFLRTTRFAGARRKSPVLLPLTANVRMEEIEERCGGGGPVFACDFYVSGAERGTPVPGGFELGRILNVDHHAPVARMQRAVTSTALALDHLRAFGRPRRSSRTSVVINHTDCDSILSSALLMGHIDPRDVFASASVAADHSGEANPIADLLQGMDETRDGNRTADHYVESVKSLLLLLEGHRLPAASQRALDRRLARRDAAAKFVSNGSFHSDGPLVWAILDEEIDTAFFRPHLADAALIMVAQPRSDAANRWNVKLRLGQAAPPGFTLHSLGIRGWNPAFGGRWNAGSNKRGGGTSVAPHDYANRLLASIIHGFGDLTPPASRRPPERVFRSP